MTVEAMMRPADDMASTGDNRPGPVSDTRVGSLHGYEIDDTD
jgi:hypothetical protein